MRSLRVPALLVLATLLTNTAAAQPAKTPRLDRHGDPLPDGVLVRLGTARFQPPGALTS